MNSVQNPFLSITANRATHASVSLRGLGLLDADAKWQSLHTPEEARQKIKAEIKAENRDTALTHSSDVRFRDDGVVIANGEELVFSENGFRRFVQHLSCGGASFLLKTDPDIRAMALNRVLQNKYDGKFLLHSRDTREGREIFSVTGPNFPTEGTSLDLIDKIADSSPEGSRVLYSYDPNTATTSYETILKMYDRADHKIGDLHQGGIQWLLRDAGFGSILPSFKIYRHACANLMMFESKSYALRRAVHRGSMETIRSSIEGAFLESAQLLSRFYALWQKADDPYSHVKMISADPGMYTSPEEYAPDIYERLLRNYKGLQIPKLSKEQQIDTYVKGFNVDPVHSWRGIINGITHTAKDRPLNVSQSIQEAAGEILDDLKV